MQIRFKQLTRYAIAAVAIATLGVMAWASQNGAQQNSTTQKISDPSSQVLTPAADSVSSSTSAGSDASTPNVKVTVNGQNVDTPENTTKVVQNGDSRTVVTNTTSNSGSGTNNNDNDVNVSVSSTGGNTNGFQSTTVTNSGFSNDQQSSNSSTETYNSDSYTSN